MIKFGNHALDVISTPGHSPGSVVLYSKDENVAFTGDTLFRLSIGRTDFQLGSYQDMMKSLKNSVRCCLPTASYCPDTENRRPWDSKPHTTHTSNNPA